MLSSLLSVLVKYLSKQMNSIQETERGVTHLPVIVSNSHINRDVHTYTNHTHTQVSTGCHIVLIQHCWWGVGVWRGFWTVNDNKGEGDQETLAIGKSGKLRFALELIHFLRPSSHHTFFSHCSHVFAADSMPTQIHTTHKSSGCFFAFYFCLYCPKSWICHRGLCNVPQHPLRSLK